MSIAPLDDENAALLKDAPVLGEPILHLVPSLVDEPAPEPVVPLVEEQVRDAVALHAAAHFLPARASMSQREETRHRWFAALKTIMDIADHPHWALAYLPGVHYGDNDTYAVHLPTGRVFGGECGTTAQRSWEGTHDWLTRLTEGLDHLLTEYRYQRPRHTDG